MALLPPVLVGPVTPVMPSIRVEHLLPGAQAKIHVNGTATGDVAVATSNAVDVPISAPLPPGVRVTATWTLGAETSGPSLPQVVLPYPAKLGAPVFLSPIHTAMDWVELGVLYPGATVTVRAANGTVLGGPDIAGGASARIRISGSIGDGDRLHAVQSVDPPSGPPVVSPDAESLKAEQWYEREQLPPVPSVLQPIRECAGAVLVGGAVPGCTVVLRRSGTAAEYPAVGSSFWAVLPTEAKRTDTFAAANRLARLNRDSAFSAAVGVDPAVPLDTPRLAPDTQYCPQVVSVTASDLAPRAALTFELRGASGSTTLFRAGAPDDRRTDTYFLGDLAASIPAAPPFPAVVLVERLCALAAESNRAGVHRRAGQPEVPPGFFFRPRECATAVHVVNVTSCVVTIHSNAADWPILASWAIVPASDWVPVNRPLRADERIWVTVEAGCLPPGLRESDRVPVEAADLTQMRIVGPVRPGQMRTIYLRDAVPGARVHVYVNDKWRASATALSTAGSLWAQVFVGVLHERNVVTAYQSACGRNSAGTTLGVVRGRIDLDASVASLVRGVATAVTVRAFDADIGKEMAGLRVRGPAGDLGWVGQPFTITASGPATTLRLTADAEGYDQGVVDLPVNSPAPPPSTLTLRSQVTLGAHIVGQKIKQISWTLTGPNAPAAQTQTPGTSSCQFGFGIPNLAGAVAWYQLSGTATIEFVDPVAGGLQTRAVSTFYTAYGLRGWLDVEWRGLPSWREINIAWAPIHDPSTGERIDTVFCFVLADDG